MQLQRLTYNAICLIGANYFVPPAFSVVHREERAATAFLLLASFLPESPLVSSFSLFQLSLHTLAILPLLCFSRNDPEYRTTPSSVILSSPELRLELPLGLRTPGYDQFFPSLQCIDNYASQFLSAICFDFEV